MIGSIRKCPSLLLPKEKMSSTYTCHKQVYHTLTCWMQILETVLRHPWWQFCQNKIFSHFQRQHTKLLVSLFQWGYFCKHYIKLKLAQASYFTTLSTYNYIQGSWLRGFCLLVWKPRAYLVAKESPCMFLSQLNAGSGCHSHKVRIFQG